MVCLLNRYSPINLFSYSDSTMNSSSKQSIGTILWSGKTIPLSIVLSLLALLCTIEFTLHLNTNGEIYIWQTYQLGNVNGATGPNNVVNGIEVRREGFVNVLNTYFFAGGTDRISLGYEIATNRLFFTFLASLLNLFTLDVLNSIAILNLLFWIAASWAAYGIGMYNLKNEFMGVIMGTLIATSQGFIATAMGTKAHLAAYSFMIIMIFLAGRLNIFEKNTSYYNYILMGVIAAVGAFINGLYLIFGIFSILMGIFKVRWRKLLLIIIIPVLFLFILKFIYAVALPKGTHIGDRTFDVLIKHIIIHFKAIYLYITSDKQISYSFLRFQYDNIGKPFQWISSYASNFILLCGVPFLLLSVAGVLRITWAQVRLAFSVLLSVSTTIFLVQSYWPSHSFWGYSTYYAVIGFYLLSARGIENLGALVGGTAMKCGVSSHFSYMLKITSVVILLAGLIVFTNQDIFFGRMIEYFRFHWRYALSAYPADWNFDILGW